MAFGRFFHFLHTNFCFFVDSGIDQHWNRLSHILEKNEVPETLNGFLVKFEDATIIIPVSTLVSS